MDNSWIVVLDGPKEICVEQKVARTACSHLQRRPFYVYLQIKYRKARVHARPLMRKARRNLWAAYVSILSARIQMSQILKCVQKIAEKFLPPADLVLRMMSAAVVVLKEVAKIFGVVSSGNRLRRSSP